MASTRAFKNLASLRSSFDVPIEEEVGAFAEPPPPTPDPVQTSFIAAAPPSARLHIHAVNTAPLTPVSGRVDRRRLRKVLKTPSVSLSVAVRSELHEDVSAMLFANKSTWIALLDDLLSSYVAQARAEKRFPK